MDDHIPGGYFLFAREWPDRDVFKNGPPLRSKMWNSLLNKANFKDNGPIKRGQLHTTIAEMQEENSHYRGFRKIMPTKEEIRNAYEALKKAKLINIRKTTRGMIITIYNYDKYQNPKSYETHSEDHTENRTKTTTPPHYTRKKGNEERNIPQIS